jgi:GT2 family glycosyltransferase
VRFVEGLCWCLKNFLQIGGFDDDFFAYFEDVDFCWRAWIFGYKVVYVPTSVVFHKVGGSFNYLSSKTLFLFERNRLYTILKNFELRGLLVAVILSIPYDLAKVATSFLAGSNRLFSANLKASLFVMRHLNLVLSKRKSISKGRILPDRVLYERNVICSIRECLQEFRKSKW